MSNKYDNYKDSGIEWIGEIPSHWEVKRGKYLFKIVSGYSPENVEEQIRKFGIPYFKVNDLNDKSEVFNLEKSNLYVAEDILNTSPKETILFPKRGAAISTNKVKISTSDCIFDTNIMGLIPFKEKIHFRYLAYSLSNRGLWDIADTSTIPQINNKHIEPLEFVLPETIEEQKNIVEFIDHKTSQIDHLIAKKEQFIKLLEEERVAVINQAVTTGLDPNVPLKDSGVEWLGEIPEHWEVKKLKYLVICNRNTLSENSEPTQIINYIEIGDVNFEKGITGYTEYSFEKAPSRARRIVHSEDVIVSTVRTYLKAIATIKEEYDGFIASTGFAVLTPKEIYFKFLSYLVLTNGFIDSVISLSKGVSYPSITSQDLLNISICLPNNIEEQHAISCHLDIKISEIDKIITKSHQEIELLKEYKTALISEVVTGKVDIRNEILN